jgi:hypothetical protein
MHKIETLQENNLRIAIEKDREETLKLAKEIMDVFYRKYDPVVNKIMAMLIARVES